MERLSEVRVAPRVASSYRICARCVMDTSDPEIAFDPRGVCRHCLHYDERASRELHDDEAGQKALRQVVEKIKAEGLGKDYDCIIGVSGGVDSTMTAYLVRQHGLRPLAVHLDNGWNSELAVKNIENLVRRLGIDLYTHVVDWEEFRDLHVAFLKASVANSEIPTDHAIVAILYRTADEKGVRYIIGGGNIATEAIMPSSWMYDAKDWRHLRAIHKRFGKVPLKTFPRLGLFGFFRHIVLKGIRWFPILNYIRYNKREALALLEREIGYRPYPAKHFESIYTRFFQGYILPKKFHIDKRRAHFSTLICSGQMTRGEALRELQGEACPPEMLKQDREFAIKKLGLTEEEFETIMATPPRSHRDYPSNRLWLDLLKARGKRIATKV